jgi:hypothetical protein
MKRIQSILDKYPLHVFLLPVFFVLHSYITYYGLAPAGTAMLLGTKIEILAGLFFLALRFLMRSWQRSAQITSLLVFVFLFYGVIKDFFKVTLHADFLGRYLVLLPLIALVTGWLIVLICKKANFSRLNRFENGLLILSILVDGLVLLYTDTEKFIQSNQLVKNTALKISNLPVPSERPDVYFLVFDSYPGTRMLHEYLHYDNRTQDSILQSIGFFVAGRPLSNYNHTPLSIASTLNFEYLRTIANHSNLFPKDYNQAALSIEHSVVPAVFLRNGYKFYNLSVFDFPGHPSIQKNSLLALPAEKMLLFNTLTSRFYQDIAWHFSMFKPASLQLEQRYKQDEDEFAEMTNEKEFNNTIIDSVLKIPSAREMSPKFIYCHFYLPHAPLFYDSSGRALPIDVALMNKEKKEKRPFLSYLEYTNKTMLKIVRTVLHDSPRPPVIIIQSDHNYRDLSEDTVPVSQYCSNYSAFYFPDKSYNKLYDSISNINTFPVIFNKYFGTRIPLQRDSSIFTVY